MKKIIMLLAVLGSLNSYALECPVDFGTENYVDKVSSIIAHKKTCYEANEITEACAMGSSIDVQLVSSALKVCSKRISRSASAKKAVDSANILCTKKFAKSSGTMAMSARAFCELQVSKLYDDLLTPAEI